MLLGNRLFGVLAVCVDQPNIFDDAECELLQELANDLAFALRSIETESERRQAEEH
jgi:GAF domain-containing protein